MGLKLSLREGGAGCSRTRKRVRQLPASPVARTEEPQSKECLHSGEPQAGVSHMQAQMQDLCGSLLPDVRFLGVCGVEAQALTVQTVEGFSLPHHS